MSSLTIKAIVLAIIGLLVFIGYKVSNLFSKNKGKRLLKKCSDNSEYAREVAESLTFLYGKTDLTEGTFKNRIKQISENFQIGDTRVIFFREVKPDNYLFITYFTDMDLNVSIRGEMGEMVNVHQINYRVSIDRTKGLVKIYSEICTNSEDKNLRSIFTRKMLKYLTEEQEPVTVS